MKKTTPKTLLIIKNRALGDSVITLGAIQYLRDTLKDTEIIYAVPSWIYPLYKNTHTAAHKVIPMDFKTAKDWWDSYKVIKGFEVDTVLEFFQSGRTNKFFKLVSALGLVKYHFHNHHKKVGDVHDQGVIKSNIQRDLDAAWSFFGEKNNYPNFLDYTPSMSLPTQKLDQITFGVVATRKTKMWAMESYRDLAQLIFQDNPQMKIIIPLGPGDDEIEDSIYQLQFPQNCYIIKEKLDKLPSSLAASRLYIGNDTGLKHISIALGVPTLSFFGPEPPTEWHPYNIDQNPFYFKEGLECRTREAHYCGLAECESMICLSQFSPTQVFQDYLKKFRSA
jgi:heptosyltransferase II